MCAIMIYIGIFYLEGRQKKGETIYNKSAGIFSKMAGKEEISGLKGRETNDDIVVAGGNGIFSCRHSGIFPQKNYSYRNASFNPLVPRKVIKA